MHPTDTALSERAFQAVFNIHRLQSMRENAYTTALSRHSPIYSAVVTEAPTPPKKSAAFLTHQLGIISAARLLGEKLFPTLWNTKLEQAPVTCSTVAENFAPMPSPNGTKATPATLATQYITLLANQNEASRFKPQRHPLTLFLSKAHAIYAALRTDTGFIRNKGGKSLQINAQQMEYDLKSNAVWLTYWLGALPKTSSRGWSSGVKPPERFLLADATLPANFNIVDACFGPTERPANGEIESVFTSLKEGL